MLLCSFAFFPGFLLSVDSLSRISQCFNETESRSGLHSRFYKKKFYVVYRPLLVASVFKAEEDGCYFCACTCMCLIFLWLLSIALCTLSKSTIQIEKLINKIVINQVISYWPSYRSSASYIGPRLRLGPIQQTSDL